VGYTQNEQALAAVSNEGTLVVLEGSRGALSQLHWLDRKGVDVGSSPEPELIGDIALSHDGKRLAMSINGVGQGATDLWILNLERRVSSRLSFEEGGESNQVWSRDDRFVYYQNDRRNDGVIFRRRSDGTGAPEEIGTTPAGVMPQAISSDGTWLVVESVVGETGFDLLRFDVATQQATPLVASPFFDRDGKLSPDDRLLAYASEESGRWEVYVQSLVGERGRWQVSSESGRGPRWRADGRELYFLAPPGRIMAVDVEPGDVPRFSAPHELFRVPAENYDVSPDGQRFVTATFAASATDKPLTLITHWISRLPKR
jgi:Tol biopolymer transport system component